MSDVAISIKNVSKSFKLPHEKSGSIKNTLLRLHKNKGFENQQVLKNISFDIKKGEFFGILGRNGSGKSTLLKLISQIYTPDKGHITVDGKLTPFIELGVGFNPELTGKENVFLNGALLGFSRDEISTMYNEIVEFAELEKFMDQKLKNYSSGMQVRLAFSIAIRANTEILVLDEVLAVGDYNFQQKCFEYFRQLKRQGKTVILVSHDSSAIQMFCTRAVLLEEGQIKQQGKASEVLKAYADQNQTDQEKAAAKSQNGPKKRIEKGSGSVKLLEAYALKNDKPTKTYSPKDIIDVRFQIKFLHDIEDPVFGLIIENAEGGQPIFATNTLDMRIKTGSYKAGEEKTIQFKMKNMFNDGKYYISGAVASSDRTVLYVRYINTITFSVVGWNVTAKSRVYLDHEFKVS